MEQTWPQSGIDTDLWLRTHVSDYSLDWVPPGVVVAFGRLARGVVLLRPGRSASASALLWNAVFIIALSPSSGPLRNRVNRRRPPGLPYRAPSPNFDCAPGSAEDGANAALGRQPCGLIHR